MYQKVSQVALGVNNPPANAGKLRDMDSIPGLGRSSGGGHSNPLQYSCLENPMDRVAWGATIHRITKTQLKWLSTHAWYQKPKEEKWHYHLNRCRKNTGWNPIPIYDNLGQQVRNRGEPPQFDKKNVYKKKPTINITLNVKKLSC